METLLAVGDGAQQDRVEGGSVRVSELMAEALGDRVFLDSPVRTIRQDEDGVTVITRDGTQHRDPDQDPRAAGYARRIRTWARLTGGATRLLRSCRGAV